MYRKEILFAAVTLFACALANPILEKAKHPDAGLRVPELVSKYNYPLESHTVETEDGYLITMHRIPHGINNADVPNKPVVFLMHGFLCSSSDWIIMGPKKGLAYLLADMGYDVWMGNARGNTYSRKHATLNPDSDKEFWNFSWHEIGIRDLPAMIDYVLEKTQVEKLFYIAHSQGTTAFFVMTSSLPEYNDKIQLMVALGPAAYMANTPNPVLKKIAPYVNYISWIAKYLGINEFLPSSQFIQDLSIELCDVENKLHDICNNILFLIAGYDQEQLDENMLQVILTNTPAGAATKQAIHFGQLFNSKKFRQYDYGINNWKHYHSLSPPKYDISKITAPVALFSGKNDLLVSTIDVNHLNDELPNSVLNHVVSYEKFSHLDFLWAIDVVELLYNDVFDILKKYSIEN